MCVHKGVFPCQIQVDNYSKVLQDKKNPIRQQWETQRHKFEDLIQVFRAKWQIRS